jgi:hypothetical protein
VPITDPVSRATSSGPVVEQRQAVSTRTVSASFRAEAPPGRFEDPLSGGVLVVLAVSHRESRSVLLVQAFGQFYYDHNMMHAQGATAMTTAPTPTDATPVCPDAGHGGLFQFHEDFVKRALEFL